MQQIKKAIILSAGYGTRRLPITKAIEKNMLPLGNRPIIDYIVEDCVAAGVTDIYFVINDTPHSQLKAYYGENQPLEKFLRDKNATEKLTLLKTAPDNVNFHYATQPADKYGTAFAIAVAIKEFGLNEQIIMRNGDDPFWNAPGGSEMKNFLKQINSSDESAIIGAEKPRQEMPGYGMLVVKNGYLQEIVEKPALENVTSNLANVNGYVLSPKLLQMIVDYVDRHDFGSDDQEYLITEPVTDYVKAGNPMRAIPATGQWLDSGNLAGWLHANQIICGDLLNPPKSAKL
jgi:UTP--glucose-1-phosphate uridylyltransferase